MGNQESVPASNQRKVPIQRTVRHENDQTKLRQTRRREERETFPQRVEQTEYISQKEIQERKIKEEFLRQQQRNLERHNQQMPQHFENKQPPQRRMDDMLMERGRMEIQQQNQYQQNLNQGYRDMYSLQKPVNHELRNSSTQLIQRNMDTLKLTPHNFQDQIEKYQKDCEEEKIQFEQEERRRRQEFNSYLDKKTEYLKREIQSFEENYDPFQVLNLPKNHYHLHDIKKAYKKLALKYHPDKAGSEYADQFQLITQAYVYLLNKCEEMRSTETKISREVVHQEYEDNVNERGVENIYISKDKFNINQFNEIFEKYHMQEDENEGGYGNLYKQRDDEVGDSSKVFGTNFNKEIFNAHFDSIKKSKKQSTDVIEYYEPEALVSSNISFKEYGKGREEDFTGRSSVAYTDYKRAHIDDNVFIDPNAVQRKEYRNLDDLKSDRDGISFTATREDSLRQQAFERMRQEREEQRLQKLREQDERFERQYKKVNQRLIVHKKD